MYSLEIYTCWHCNNHSCCSK